MFDADLAISQSIMLPREGLDEVEEDDALRRLEQNVSADRGGHA